jgi:Arc/MetJ-type ribon-helix-helix transcriptional regulator
MSNARTEFEKWAQFNFYPIAHEPNGVGLDGGPVYKDPRTHAAWCVYQWRQARGQAEPLTDERIDAAYNEGRSREREEWESRSSVIRAELQAWQERHDHLLRLIAEGRAMLPAPPMIVSAADFASIRAEAPEPNEQKPGIKREITTPTGEPSSSVHSTERPV